jgi:ACT domain-containing protein
MDISKADLPGKVVAVINPITKATSPVINNRLSCTLKLGQIIKHLRTKKQVKTTEGNVTKCKESIGESVTSP